MKLDYLEMPATIVGIDIETTALDPASGDIIEVAAIRYDTSTRNEIDRYVQLTRPTKRVTAEITGLTGITQEMVEGSPTFKSIKREFTKFVGDDLVFAHNAPFDRSFLAYHGVRLDNKVWDTFPLATIAFPEAESYNLGMLAQILNLAVEDEHRAAGDITMTWSVLIGIVEHLFAEKETLENISKVLVGASLEHYLPLFSVGTWQKKQMSVRKDYADISDTSHFHSEHGKQNEVRSDFKEEIVIDHVFKKGGILDSVLLGFEFRAQQLEMAREVERVLKKNGIGLIEGGTGTGKTFAYLVPVILAAKDKGPMIISTFTKHLQDQLISKDIPALLKAMGITRKIATLKGRSNYVCSKRLKTMLNQASFNESEAFFLIKLILWLDKGAIGDMDRLNLSHQAFRYVLRVNADHLICRKTCKLSEKCLYQLARAKAKEADILVVNHALLIMMSVGAEVNIGARSIIIDEAHHLEGVARSASALDLSVERVKAITEQLIKKLPTKAKRLSLDTHILSECENLVNDYGAMLIMAYNFVDQHSIYGRVRLTAGTKRSSSWKKFQDAGGAIVGRVSFIKGLVKSRQPNMSSYLRQDVDDVLVELEQFSIELTNFMRGSSERVQWIEKDYYDGVSNIGVLHDVALSAAAVVSGLISNTQSIVLTSATLTSAGTFKFLKERLGISETIIEKVIGTPFKYQDAMLIYMVDDGPIPNEPSFDRFSSRRIVEIAKMTHGRLLGLFTSKASVKAIYKMAIRPLNKAAIKLYAQGITGGKFGMLSRFRENSKSVLLGTDSFWEGVDVPGESLSAVVIPRLPFPNPDDPIIAAVAEAEGISAFRDLGLPTMLIKLRQGVGRLIRHQNDKGVIVLLDARIHKQQYGDLVLKSLPPGQIMVGSWRDMNRHIGDWFGVDTISRWKDNAN